MMYLLNNKAHSGEVQLMAMRRICLCDYSNVHCTVFVIFNKDVKDRQPVKEEINDEVCGASILYLVHYWG